MIFPLGEYLIFSLGVYAFVYGSTQSSRLFWGGVWIAWLAGALLEALFTWQGAYHWHFSRVLVMVFFAGIAWEKTSERKILPSLVIAFALAAQNLFAVNEPGIFKGEQWFFGAIVLLTVLITTKDFWGMGLALIGGILLDLGISIFVFHGVVRHYDLPNLFFWNLSAAFLAIVASINIQGKKRNAENIEMSEKK